MSHRDDCRFDLRLRQRQVQTQQLEVQNTIIQRDRDTAADAPRALLSYNDVVAMNPTSKGKHDMSNKEWKTFQEESTKWFTATRMGSFPQTNQTRLMGITSCAHEHARKENGGGPQENACS